MVMQKKVPLPLEIVVEDKRIQIITTGGEVYCLSIDCALLIQRSLNNAINSLSVPELSGDQLFNFLVEKASYFLGVKPELITGTCRKREFVVPRQMLMTFIDQRRFYTKKKIGNYFSGKDHTTVVHSVRTVKDLCDTNEDYRISYERLTDYLNDVVSQSAIK